MAALTNQLEAFQSFIFSDEHSALQGLAPETGGPWG